MSIQLIQEKLNTYHCESVQEEENAIREIAQEVVLGGLSRAGFFKKAAFQGGTCLRILYGLERFSEDLDFVLMEHQDTFDLNKYLEALNHELEAYGFDCRLKDRKDVSKAAQKQFVKGNSLAKLLNFEHFRPGRDTRDISIKLEVDTNPPEASEFETKYHDYPFAYEIVVQNEESLFASKSHALLCREYMKGRDWYDFLWYVRRGSGLNYALLAAAIEQQGPWSGKSIEVDKKWYLAEMKKKIEQTDFAEVREDVRRFLKPNELKSLDLWSTDFFLDRLSKLAKSV